MGSDKSYLDIEPEFLEATTDMGKYQAWFQHRLWRKCPVADCEWCAADAIERGE